MGHFHWRTIGMLILVAFLLIWTEMPATRVIAETLTEGVFEYTDNGDGTATITGYTGMDTEIDIPEMLDVLTVTRIGSSAFREKGLTRVEIPYGVTFIGTHAFAYNMLEEINIPGSVTTIDAYAFRSNRLTKVQLSNGLKIIYSGVFYENRLTEIIIPNLVELIASNAFSKNELTEVHIPKNVTQVELAFFYNPLVKITVDEENTVYKDIDQKGVYTKDGKKLVQGTISGDIDPDTEEIGGSAFRGIGLTEADIPNGVKKIGPQAFQDNVIEQLSLPDSLEAIYMLAFAGNDLTEAIIWGDPEFGQDVFRENPSGLTLWGYTGTSVKTYAEANHHAFEPLNTFADGLGTEVAPYIIETPEQLDAVRHDLQAHYKLGANIDLSDYQSGEGWVPIGNNSRFNGSFDGDGFTITALMINRNSDVQGLFASLGESSIIRNIRLDNAAVNGRNNIGGLAGTNFGIIADSSVISGAVNGLNRVGGLVGGNYGTEITTSFAAANVSGDDFIGGLVGENSGSHGVVKTIRYSYASGEVTGKVHVGGLIGGNETANAGSTIEIIDSYATGEVTAQKQAGGLVGRNFSLPGGTITISNSYATGDVFGEEQYAGGLIGYNRISSDSAIEVIHSYAFGEVTTGAEAEDVGGLVGENAASPGSSIAINSSYWNKSAYTGETPDNGIGTSKTATELMERDTFADWDFTNAWYQYNEQTLPFLQWQNPIVSWDADIAKDVLGIDESTEIAVNVTHENNESYAGADIAGYSVNPEIAGVDRGTVTALRGGKAVITVSLFGESRTIDLTVDGGKPTEPAITLDSEGWTNAAEVNVMIDHESEDVRSNVVQTIRVKAGDAAWQDYAYGDLPIALKVTTEGTTIIQALAIDELGNESDIARQTVKINRSGLRVESSLVSADDDQTEYDSGSWTNHSVTATVYAWHAQGVTVTSVVYSLDEGAVWINYDEPLAFSEEGDHSLLFKAADEAGNEFIDRLRIRIDGTVPEIQFSPDGNESASRNASSQVAVIDENSGVDGASLLYAWSTNSDLLDERADWQAFQNGRTLNGHRADGDWYLHIRAKDQAGNERYAVSKRFRIRADEQGGNDHVDGTYIGSTHAKLSELIVLEGRLTPAFSADVTAYTVSVAHESDSLVLTVRAAHRLATLKINDQSFANHQERIHVPLVEGANTIEILVTAEDGTRKTYTLTVEREAAKPEPSQQTFTDIAGHWAESFIMEAVGKGFIHGYPGGIFKPDDPVTRAEFTVMLAAVLEWEGEETAGIFTDSDQIGLWAKRAIAQAARKLGIVSGRGGNKFIPNDMATRAEATVVLLRMQEQR